jgi:hypothetical protein
VRADVFDLAETDARIGVDEDHRALLDIREGCTEVSNVRFSICKDRDFAAVRPLGVFGGPIERSGLSAFGAFGTPRPFPYLTGKPTFPLVR